MALRTAYVALSPEYVPPITYVSDHTLYMIAQSPGLNQWANCLVVAQGLSFLTGVAWGNHDTQYGYWSGPNLTEMKYECHSITPSRVPTTVTVHFWKYTAAPEKQTHYFIASNTQPTGLADLLTWDVVGEIYLGTGGPYQADISALTGFVDTSVEFWLSAIPKHHYDGDDPSTWPDALSSGTSIWTNMQYVEME